MKRHERAIKATLAGATLTNQERDSLLKAFAEVYALEAETLDNSFKPYNWRIPNLLDSIDQDPMVRAMRKARRLINRQARPPRPKKTK